MKNLEGAKCAGKPGLFESPIIAVHVQARKLCATCPVLLGCHELLLDVMADTTGGPAGAPSGTWAGVLYKQGRRIRVPANWEKESA
jgi:hypothetical protein